MKYLTGNLLDAPTEALVNTVNTVGVMGKGIALQFKERFPMNFKIYADACKKKTIDIGKLLVVKENTISGTQYIINFPTKTEWYKKSQYKYIEEGLKDLVNVLNQYKIRSIALPPLGCGNGGLKWDKVKLMMEKYLGELRDIEILIFEPNAAIKQILQQEMTPKEVKLTPGRAMLLYTLFHYQKIGEDASVFAANKLAYFLQSTGEPLRLKFIPYTYGPYDQAVEKVLYALNGKYLKGLEQMSSTKLEPLELVWERFGEVEAYVNNQLSNDQRQRLTNLFKVIAGFESTLSLEILSSIHFLVNLHGNSLSKFEILDKIKSWNKRKEELITEDYVDIALDHLKEYGDHLFMA